MLHETPWGSFQAPQKRKRGSEKMYKQAAEMKLQFSPRQLKYISKDMTQMYFPTAGKLPIGNLKCNIFTKGCLPNFEPDDCWLYR
jgi:hypothetical protein